MRCSTSAENPFGSRPAFKACDCRLLPISDKCARPGPQPGRQKFCVACPFLSKILALLDAGRSSRSHRTAIKPNNRKQRDAHEQNRESSPYHAPKGRTPMKMINSTNPTRISATLVMISVALVAAIAALSAAQVPRSGYTYSKIATLGVGGVSGDFEVGGLNNAGDAVFVSETSQCLDNPVPPPNGGFPLCETAFLYRAGQVSEILPPSSPGTS